MVFRSHRQALIIRRSPVLWVLVWRPVCQGLSEGSRREVSLWRETSFLPTSGHLSGSPALSSPSIGVGKVGTTVTYRVSPHMAQSDSIHFPLETQRKQAISLRPRPLPFPHSQIPHTLIPHETRLIWVVWISAWRHGEASSSWALREGKDLGRYSGGTVRTKV